MSTQRWRALATVGLVVLALPGCRFTAPSTAPAPAAPVSAAPASPQPGGRSPSAPQAASPEQTGAGEPGPGAEVLLTGFERLEPKFSGSVGIVVVQIDAVGRQAGSSRRGTWLGGPAWSTIKVPLALAALAQHDDASTRAAVRRAIRASDNAAAQDLWRGLGPAKTAAARVQNELRSRGDRVTTVEDEVLRPGFSAFGQTQWRLSDQAVFAARLVCADDASTVLDEMTRITASQQWGLGHVDGSAFKGGWGPRSSGNGYTVRQMGLLQTSDGSTWGIAVSSESADGFEAAVQDLDQTSRWLNRRLRQEGYPYPAGSAAADML